MLRKVMRLGMVLVGGAEVGRAGWGFKKAFPAHQDAGVQFDNGFYGNTGASIEIWETSG